MTTLPAEDLQFEERFEEEESQLLLDRYRFTLKIGLFVWPAYYFLDRITSPEHAGNFLRVRILIFGLFVLLLVAARTSWTRWIALPLSMLPYLAMSVGISAMTTYLGGFASDYYVGNMVVLFAAGLLMPWSGGMALLFGAMFIGIYVVAVGK